MFQIHFILFIQVLYKTIITFTANLNFVLTLESLSYNTLLNNLIIEIKLNQKSKRKNNIIIQTIWLGRKRLEQLFSYPKYINRYQIVTTSDCNNL